MTCVYARITWAYAWAQSERIPEHLSALKTALTSLRAARRSSCVWFEPSRAHDRIARYQRDCGRCCPGRSTSAAMYQPRCSEGSGSSRAAPCLTKTADHDAPRARCRVNDLSTL
jgi:hypothetical protein